MKYIIIETNMKNGMYLSPAFMLPFWSIASIIDAKRDITRRDPIANHLNALASIDNLEKSIIPRLAPDVPDELMSEPML
jgi:hypothetical protein